VASKTGAAIERFSVLVVGSRDSRQQLASFPEEEHPEGALHLGVPTQDFEIEVHANGWMPGHYGPFPSDRAPARLTCQLEPASGVSGRVLAGGQPLPGALLTLRAAMTTDSSYNGFALHAELQPIVSATSDAQGEFSLSVEERGDYYLRAEREGYAWRRSALRPGTGRPAQTGTSSRARGLIEVTLRSSARPLGAGELVAFSRGDGLARTQRVGPTGTLPLNDSTPGRWQVVLSEKPIDPRYGLRAGTKERGDIPELRGVAGEVTHPTRG
jgi:hypothetical protein